MLKRLIRNQVSSKSLAIFRMAYGLVLMLEILRLHTFRRLIYDKVPYFEPGEITFDYIFVVWFVAVIALIVGYKTRIAALLNYLLGFFLIGTITTYEYHMFYTYMGVNFLFLIIPVAKSYSIDNLLERINKSTIRKNYVPDEKVSEFYYYLLIFFGVGIVYLDSTLYKLVSTMWMAGLGMWEPASVLFVANVNATTFLNMEFIMKFLGYFTVVFEIVFTFLFWKKMFKIPFFIIGMGLHIGIWILFPIPQFAQGVICIYLLLLPFNYPELIKLPKAKNPLLFFYDMECPLCLRTKIVIEFFDIFKGIKFLPVQSNYSQYEQLKELKYEELLDDVFSISNGKVRSGVDTYISSLKKMIYLYPVALLIQIPGVYHLAKYIYSIVAKNRNAERCNEDNCEVGFMGKNTESHNIKIFKNLTSEDLKEFGLKTMFISFIVIQCFVSLRSPLLNNYVLTKIDNKTLTESVVAVKGYSKRLLGMTNHGVFMESHFENYNHVIRVDFVKSDKSLVTLPIIDKNGMPSDYLKNFNWIKWTFRVNHPDVDMKMLEKGIRDFTAYWLHNSELIRKPKGKHEFKIFCKKIDAPNGFEKDFLNKQIAKPWMEIGTASWNNGEFTLSVPEIESL